MKSSHHRKLLFKINKISVYLFIYLSIYDNMNIQKNPINAFMQNTFGCRQGEANWFQDIFLHQSENQLPLTIAVFSFLDSFLSISTMSSFTSSFLMATWWTFQTGWVTLSTSTLKSEEMLSLLVLG